MFNVAIWFSAGMALFSGLLTAAVAIGASVAWKAVITRTLMAALVVGALTYAVSWYLGRIIEENNSKSLGESNLEEEDSSTIAETSKGNHLDVKLPTEKPFVPGQIEADLEELLATDPARAAEIIRKMQLEE
ncbi:hypothetical protein F9B85_01420 [Heliorestis acidaminivorans]|uniref:Uncharacterized protein n=1 Tax=Heliorestis acidaminivorans TaxID=553427 RepID=A0A6I0F0A6_9FIRM|nr:hypothetical protein [Heliorestis acidaminivorans]KAB2954376.1 hypothetical protein F9B85_01420 [Heliorestis acidaminivorans]